MEYKKSTYIVNLFLVKKNSFDRCRKLIKNHFYWNFEKILKRKQCYELCYVHVLLLKGYLGADILDSVNHSPLFSSDSVFTLSLSLGLLPLPDI